jgi:hypothetical protein
MFAKDLFDLRSILRQKGVIFAYSGYVTEPVLSGVGDAIKQTLTMEDADTRTVRSVFAVFVEQMQNIIRYSAEKVPPDGARGEPPLELRYGILTIGQEDGCYVVQAGNLIDRADVEHIRERLGEIRTMDRAQLKAFYKKQLKAEPDEQSKGAGVGFVEIARRASKPIEFDFKKFDDKYAFFALKAYISA